MGGYVIVNTYDGEATAYGLTAGHILTQKDYDIPSSDRSSAGAIPSLHLSDSEDDDTTIPENNAQSRDRDLLECSLSSRVDTAWTDMKIAEVSFSNEAKDRDWALIEDIRTGHVDRSYSRANNPRTSFGNGGENMTMVLGTVGEQRFLQIGFDTVVGTDCTLSQTSSLIITPSGHNFVPVYTLVPDTARVLPDGVSGTWVTARPTGFVKSISVYGQVIADDMFGDVYMIPLRAIIDDIRSLMDAAVVRLPKSMKELSQILTSQSQRERTGLQSDTSSRDHSGGYSRSLPVLAFQGTMELQARIKGFHECIDQLDLKLNAGGTGNTLLLGGRSMGARAAVMAASEYLAKKDNSEAEAMAVQLILTSYPLGSEDYVRNEEDVRNRELLDLPGTVEILFIVGRDDTMCPLSLLNSTRTMMAAKSKLIVVRGADHGMNVTPAHLTVDLGEETGRWAARWVMGGFTDDTVYIGVEAH
ncbi:hypothetical protein AG0111_0g11329 [Alternaria gaisen]|uniref:Uncharacterized protein n=1 Tax=Alternaria gaisen TaxID=167740 RepID=A0ACB6F7U2_9PLEO|nr:hypothetical protein AG0111_0g11329 [Alternaria gaisen]